MDRTVLTFSAENTITIFVMVSIVAGSIGLVAKLLHAKASK